MSEPVGSFDAMYARETIAEAARAFRYQFKRYGLLFVGACMLNAAGLALIHLFGGKHDAAFFVIVLIVMLGPMFLLYQYFVGPRTFALKLRLLLAPTGRVTVGPNGVVLPIRARELLLPWSTVKTVLERPTLFLLVLSPLSPYFVPRLGMPTTVYEVLHSKAHVVAA